MLLFKKGLAALEEMRKLDQEQVDYIVAKASVAALDAHGELAKHAYEETGRGVFEDKATKIYLLVSMWLITCAIKKQ